MSNGHQSPSFSSSSSSTDVDVTTPEQIVPDGVDDAITITPPNQLIDDTAVDGGEITTTPSNQTITTLSAPPSLPPRRKRSAYDLGLHDAYCSCPICLETGSPTFAVGRRMRRRIESSCHVEAISTPSSPPPCKAKRRLPFSDPKKPQLRRYNNTQCTCGICATCISQTFDAAHIMLLLHNHTHTHTHNHLHFHLHINGSNTQSCGCCRCVKKY